jgi:hypothetical protein
MILFRQQNLIIWKNLYFIISSPILTELNSKCMITLKIVHSEIVKYPEVRICLQMITLYEPLNSTVNKNEYQNLFNQRMEYVLSNNVSFGFIKPLGFYFLFLHLFRNFHHFFLYYYLFLYYHCHYHYLSHQLHSLSSHYLLPFLQFCG